MEKVVVSGGRSEGMGWVTLLPAKLVESQINEIFTWENGKNDFTHKQGNLRCVLWILLLLYQIKAVPVPAFIPTQFIIYHKYTKMLDEFNEMT